MRQPIIKAEAAFLIFGESLVTYWPSALYLNDAGKLSNLRVGFFIPFCFHYVLCHVLGLFR